MPRFLVPLIVLTAPAALSGAQAMPTQGCVPVQVVSGGMDPLETSDSHFVSSGGRLCHSLESSVVFQDDLPAPASPSKAFAFSALLPGMGQHYLGQGRWIAYLGIEAWAWIQFFDERNEGGTLQDEYKDLAWSVARRVSSGQRIDGDFEYYEAMTKFRESGAFDADPQISGLQPETDADTFNGSVWGLAQEIFSVSDSAAVIPDESPAYQNALEYYRERSITPEFTWSWTENQLQQSVYGTLIEQSDENLRNSTTMAGVIIANHVVSAVDALISARLRIQDPDALSVTVVPLLERRQNWAVVVRFIP